MRRALAAAVLIALAFHAPTIAQQVGESVNVMPVWTPCDLTRDPNCASNPAWAEAWRYGDVFLQRQVEPSVAVASGNPEHVLTAVIDYSAVEVANDQGVGSTVASRAFQWIKEKLARLLGGGRERFGGAEAEEEEEAERRLPSAAALGTGEAWIRLIWSTNGGATGTPFFMPGAPWDTSPAANTAPFYLRATGATDPVVVAGPDNRFFVTFLAFRRGDINYLMVARFRDEAIADTASRHSLVFEGFAPVASGNNATFGTLNDKPHSIVVPDATSPVGYAVYVSYTVFNGNPGGKDFQSQLFVAKSTDGGRSFASTKVSQSTQQNTGTVLVPRPGGKVAALYRNFSTSPTIFVTLEGNSFTQWSKPVSILESAYPVLAAYDQGSIKLDPANPAGSAANLTPRSNAFPSGALGPDGTMYVVWQECVNPTTGVPLACASGGSPRVVLKYSRDGGATWLPTTGGRRAIDIGARTPEPDGLGYFFWVGRQAGDLTAHPQLMPAVACGGGQCMVTYWESRQAGLTPTTGRISGYTRLMDLRGALLTSTGTVSRSFQISRYPYRADVVLAPDANGVRKVVGADGTLRAENVNDVERVCTGVPGAEPQGLGVDPGCIPRLNFYARPQSGGGTTAFVGDYNALIPSAPFAPASTTTTTPAYRAASGAGDVPWVGFISAASDNRNLLPPASPMPQQVFDYAQWQPGTGGLPSCTVGGSRNSDTMLAKVSLGLLVTAPVTVQPPPAAGQAARFVVQASNNSSTAKLVSFRIGTPSAASFDQDEILNPATIPATGLTQAGVLTVNAHSMVSREVYVPATATSTDVFVSDGTITTRLTLRLSAAAAGTALAPSSLVVSPPINISAENISAENISAENISAENISAENISAENISAENISAENLGIQETTWLVQATGDATRSYVALPQVDKSFSVDYDFRLVIYRLSSIGACVDTTGKITRQYQATVVANTGPQNISAENISAENISAENISAENGFPSDTEGNRILNNSVFTPKPSASTTIATGRTAAVVAPAATCDTTTGFRIGECVDARPPEPEYVVIKLLAAPKRPLSQILAAGRKLYDPTQAPASITVADYWCGTNCAKVQQGPDLVVAAAPAVSSSTVVTGQPFAFPSADYAVTNAGNLPAGPRRYGVYLSTDATLDLVTATGLVDASKDRLLATWTPAADSQVAPGASEAVPSLSLTVPTTQAPGTYYLFLYADDRREVSELNERNNITPAAQITVLNQPDLAVSTAVPVASPSAVPAGEALTFPAGGYAIANLGPSAAGARRYGYYLSDDATFGASDLLLGTFTSTGSLAPGASETVPARSLTIPRTTTPGTRYLFVVADDLGAVAELREDNNVTPAAAITVQPPLLDLALTLQSPCTFDAASGANCTRSASGAVPLAWQFTIGGVVQDTGAVKPTLRFYRSNAQWQVCPAAGATGCVDASQSTNASWPAPIQSANPGDVATGNSDFQYCGFSGTCSSRPPGTWQYNWQRTDTTTGASLTGYFLLFIEIPGSGNTFATQRAMGPLRLRLP